MLVRVWGKILKFVKDEQFCKWYKDAQLSETKNFKVRELCGVEYYVMF